jgi:hypothetical protein
MRTVQLVASNLADPCLSSASLGGLRPQLVLAFGSVGIMKNPELGAKLAAIFPAEAILIGCSTAGEISAKGVTDESLTLTAMEFERPELRTANFSMNSAADSRAAGVSIAKDLNRENLSAILLFGQGVDINGSELVSALQGSVADTVVITGGLAADGGKFQQTFTLLNGQVSDRNVVAVGFYGKNIQVAFGSMGGWVPFGPMRKVTKSAGNILYQLDGKPALALYKEYLGDRAKELPASGLLFPLELIQENSESAGLVRTILGVDEGSNSLTFAGDIPEGGTVRLMHATDENLIEGARTAANATKQSGGNGVALLISCVGRKLVLGEMVDEEVDAVKAVFGAGTLYTGFYSNGEICPLYKVANCRLHNQTMTISYIHEVAKIK